MNKPVFLYLVVLTLALAAGCATPPPHYSDHHAIFLEKAKAGWSWKK